MLENLALKFLISWNTNKEKTWTLRKCDFRTKRRASGLAHINLTTYQCESACRNKSHYLLMMWQLPRRKAGAILEMSHAELNEWSLLFCNVRYNTSAPCQCRLRTSVALQRRACCLSHKGKSLRQQLH
jgi:hypothetical protein